MKKPVESTPESFCELAVAEADKKGFGTKAGIAKATHVALSTWLAISSKKPPDFKVMSLRKKQGWTGTVIRICDALELDLDACLKACGLEKSERVVEQSRKLVYSQEITEENLLALLEVVKKLKKSIPLQFALDYISLMNNTK